MKIHTVESHGVTVVSNEEQNQLEIRLERVRAEGPAWHKEAREELRQKGRWSRFVGGGFVTSSKDPEDYEHPYLR